MQVVFTDSAGEELWRGELTAIPAARERVYIHGRPHTARRRVWTIETKEAWETEPAVVVHVTLHPDPQEVL